MGNVYRVKAESQPRSPGRPVELRFVVYKVEKETGRVLGQQPGDNAHWGLQKEVDQLRIIVDDLGKKLRNMQSESSSKAKDA